MHVFVFVDKALEVVVLIDYNFSNGSLLLPQEVSNDFEVVLIIFTCCSLLNVGNIFQHDFFYQTSVQFYVEAVFYSPRGQGHPLGSFFLLPKPLSAWVGEHTAVLSRRGCAPH